VLHAQGGQGVGNELARLKLLESEFGVGMDMPTQLDKFRLEDAGAVKHDDDLLVLFVLEQSTGN
jgi:hypothetical protein